MIETIQKRAFWVWSAFLYIFIITPLICVILASFNQESPVNEMMAGVLLPALLDTGSAGGAEAPRRLKPAPPFPI